MVVLPQCPVSSPAQSVSSSSRRRQFTLRLPQPGRMLDFGQRRLVPPLRLRALRFGVEHHAVAATGDDRATTANLAPILVPTPFDGDAMGVCAATRGDEGFGPDVLAWLAP